MGSTTTNLSLYKPAVSETGWGTLVDASFDTLDTNIGNLNGIVTSGAEIGLVGDNSTDNSTALNNFISGLGAATNSEVTIVIAGGRYKFASTISLGTMRLKFVGVGRPVYNDPRHGTALITATNGMSLFTINAGATHNPAGPMFENLLFYDGATHSTFFDITNTSRITLRDCYLSANANTDGTTAWKSTYAAGQDSSWHLIDNCHFYNLTSGVAPTKGLGGEIRGGSFNGCATNINLLGGAAHWRVSNIKSDGGAIICLGAWNFFAGVKWEVQSTSAVQAFLIDYDGATTNSGQYNFISGLTMNCSGGASVKGLLINTNAGFNSAMGVSAAGFASSVNGVSNLSVSSNVYRIFEPPLIDLGAGPGIYTGNGAPGGVQSAPVGSYYFRLDSPGALTCIYYKQTGTGNSGWIAIA